MTDAEDKRQKAVCIERYRRREEEEQRQCSGIDFDREDECEICMETNSKVVLPSCNHAMCMKCYREWYDLSASSKLSLPCYLLLQLFVGKGSGLYKLDLRGLLSSRV